MTRAYLFLDRCTDRTEEIASQFSWVTTFRRDRNPADRFMSRYQVKCMDEGLAMARDEGFEWLLHVDADEFASGESGSALSAWIRSVAGREGDRTSSAMLTRLVSRMPENIEMVVLRPLEAIPTPLADDEPCWHLPYFTARGHWPSKLWNPITGVPQRLTRPIGHVLGKSIIRTSADVQALSAHRWTRQQKTARPKRLPIPTKHAGFHFHYVVTNFAQWYAKYKKFAEYPAVWDKGTPVDFPKQAWKEAVGRLGVSEAREYFRKYVVTNPRLLRWALLTGKVVRDDFVEQVLNAPPQD